MENFNHQITVNFSLTKYSKKGDDITNELYQVKFEDLVKEQFSSAVQIFTDGSTLRGKASSAAISSQGKRKAVRLPEGTSAFNTELYAVRVALDLIKASTSKEFVVFSDCLTMLLCLSDVNIQSKPLLQEVYSTIRDLTVNRGVTVTLCWIPGHAGIDGNDQADQLAKLSVDREDLSMVDFSNYIREEQPRFCGRFRHRNGEDQCESNKCICK